MKPMTLWPALLCLALGALVTSCNDVQRVVDSSESPGPGTGTVVGRVIPASSGARIIAEQAGPIDSTTIQAGDGSFALQGLGPGTYDIVVRAENYRIERREQVAVYDGSVTYVGAIALSTTPDPVRSFAPSDRSEVVLSAQGSRLSIGVDFDVPMNRASVQAAFSTDPPTNGTFYWSQELPRNPWDYTGPRDDTTAPPGYSDVPPGAELTTYRNIRSLRYILRQRDTFVDTTYVVRLAPSAYDSAGVDMRFGLQFSFRTIQSGVTLTRIQSEPEDGERNVSLLGSSTLRVTFPKRMNQASVENVVTITPATAPIFLWPEGNVLVLYTGGPLRAATTYAVRIEGTAHDLNGTPLGDPFQFSFETEAVKVRSSYPVNGEVFVDYSTNMRIYVGFNTYIVRSTLAAAWSISPPASGQFVWYDNMTVNFQPSAPLAPNTKYTVTVGGALRDLHGSMLQAPYSFAFVTRPE